MDAYPDPIPPETLARFRVPLRLIFWGGLLCLFDFWFTSGSKRSGFKLDILNDFVGMILITVGVFRIVAAMPPGKERRTLNLIGTVAVFSTLAAFLGHLVFEHPEPLSWALSILSLAELWAILVFCAIMGSACRHGGLDAASRSWNTTFVLFFVIYLIPLGFFHLAALVAMGTRSEFRIDLGPAGLLLLPVFFWPMVHFFVSTSRMARAVPGPADSRTLQES